jgi:SP family general alpha glucoside:H+ symporter-like MFS transporter
MQPVSTRKPVSKACDACRKRKVKCDGLQPCTGCQSANLACTFKAPRGLGGNRGPRATVLNQLRAQTTLVASIQSPGVSVEPEVSRVTTSATSETIVIDTCIEVYAKQIYPVVPLLDVAVLEAQANRLNDSPTSRRFLQAFCAYVSNFGISREGDYGAGRISAVAFRKHLLDVAMSDHNTCMGIQPEPLSVYVSFFLYGAWAGQGDYQQAWYYLREATTLYMMLRSGTDGWYDERARCHLFWILVVSER